MRAGTLLTSPQVLADLLAALDGDELPLQQRDTAGAAVRKARRPTVVWEHPAPAVHVIDGVLVGSDLIGLRAAHAAIRNGNALAAHFVAANAAHADVSMRASLRRAAALLDPVHPDLADLVRSLRVLRGAVVYRPSGRLDVDATNGSTIRTPSEGESAATASV